MGVSSDGIIVYGFDIGEELSSLGIFKENTDEDMNEDSFDEFILKEAGFSDWTELSPKNYWEQKKKILETCPIELITHCSYDYPMYIVAIRGTFSRAWRGDPKELSQDFFNVPEEKIIKAKEWCEKHEISWQTPRWLLASMYG
jgi:hypothetical protein